MSAHATTILGRFRQLDRLLQSKKFPPTSPWWHETVERFYLSGRLQLVARVGRRGGKSSTLCRLAVCEALYGLHQIPPGDTGVVAIVSANRDDASERIRTISSILTALGVRFREVGNSIELIHRPVAFRVFTASIAGVSGFTSIFVFLDEVAKWNDSKTSANPAAVVIDSIVPTAATMPEARIILSSSPMGLVDAHAAAFADGDTPAQIVAFAPTWVANPSKETTEAECRKRARNPVAFQREYAAIPQAETETSLYDTALVDIATRAHRPLDPDDHRYPLLGAFDIPPDDRHRYVATIDPATRGNAWTFVIATLSDQFVRRVVLCREWQGTKANPLKPGDVFREIARYLSMYRLQHVHSDQFAEDALREIARGHDVYIIVQPWTPATKADAYDGLQTFFQERRVDLPPDPQVKADVLGVRTKLTRNGVVYDLATVGTRHSDYAPAIAMAIGLAKIPAVALPAPHSVAEDAERAKREYLLQRTRDARRADRGLRPRLRRFG